MGIGLTNIFSGVVREPMKGLECISPLPLDLKHAVTSHRTVSSPEFFHSDKYIAQTSNCVINSNQQ